MVARAGIHVVAKWERDEFYNEVYSIETLLQITRQIISELKHPRYCFPKFVSIWPAPEVVDGIFEVCPSATKFCPLVNKPVALGFSLWWQIFDINKHFCPLVRLGPYTIWKINWFGISVILTLPFKKNRKNLIIKLIPSFLFLSLVLDTPRALLWLPRTTQQVRVPRKYVRFVRIRRRLDLRTDSQCLYWCLTAEEPDTNWFQLQSFWHEQNLRWHYEGNFVSRDDGN